MSEVGVADGSREGLEAHEALATFPLVAMAAVRWGEMDAFGHVNNVHFFRYFEVARFAYLNRIGFREGSRIGPILASTSCRFRAPLLYPDSLAIGVRSTEVDVDRFTHEYVIVSERLGRVVAVGEAIVFAYDYERAAKAPIPSDVLARIHELAAAWRGPASRRGTAVHPPQTVPRTGEGDVHEQGESR